MKNIVPGNSTRRDVLYAEVLKRDATNMTALERRGSIALWNNHPTEAVDYFDRALRAAGFWKHWPWSADLHSRLGLAYYRMDRFTEAARHYKKAAGAIPFGPFRDLAALSHWLASFTMEQPYLIEGPAATRLDFVVTDPLPVVKVSIGDGRPLFFLIDTGGSEIILDEQLATHHDVPVLATLTGQFAGAKKATIGLGRLHSIQLGDFIIKNIPIQTLDLSAVSSSLYEGIKIEGIIGTRLLMHFLATIDYRGGNLVLRRDTLENHKDLEAQIVQGPAQVIPFWLIETHYMVAWGTVNGTGPWLFFVDTGLGGISFTPMDSVYQKAGIAVDWTKAEEGVGGAGKVKEAKIKIDRLTLGTGPNELVQYNAPGSVQELSPIEECQLGVCIGGLISHQFFRDYSLTLDFRNMKLVLF